MKTQEPSKSPEVSPDHAVTEAGIIKHVLVPLYEQRGNNPERLIGQQCKDCKVLFTVNGNPSREDKIIQTNNSWQGRVVKNKAHTKRRKAAGKRG